MAVNAKEARIKQVKTWLSAPLDEANIVHRGAIEWGVTAETMRKYIRQATDEMELASRENEAELMLRSELTDIKGRAMRHADFSTAILATLMLAKMNGVKGLDDIGVVVELRR